MDNEILTSHQNATLSLSDRPSGEAPHPQLQIHVHSQRKASPQVNLCKRSRRPSLVDPLNSTGHEAFSSKSGSETLNIQVVENFKPGQTPESQRARMTQGYWECEKCGNINYPNREFCNIRKCRAPRPPSEWTCICGNRNYRNRDSCNMRKCGLPRPVDPATQAVLHKLRAAGCFREQLDDLALRGLSGSWVCTACNNLNYAERNRCNGRSCGLPRFEVDATLHTSERVGSLPPTLSVACIGNYVFPTSGEQSIVGTHIPPSLPRVFGCRDDCSPREVENPEGSWRCPDCGNVNWPRRTVCNRRGCGRLRGEAVLEGRDPENEPQSFRVKELRRLHYGPCDAVCRTGLASPGAPSSSAHDSRPFLAMADLSKVKYAEEDWKLKRKVIMKVGE